VYSTLTTVSARTTSTPTKPRRNLLVHLAHPSDQPRRFLRERWHTFCPRQMVSGSCHGQPVDIYLPRRALLPPTTRGSRRAMETAVPAKRTAEQFTVGRNAQRRLPRRGQHRSLRVSGISLPLKLCHRNQSLVMAQKRRHTWGVKSSIKHVARSGYPLTVQNIEQMLGFLHDARLLPRPAKTQSRNISRRLLSDLHPRIGGNGGVLRCAALGQHKAHGVLLRVVGACTTGEVMAIFWRALLTPDIYWTRGPKPQVSRGVKISADVNRDQCVSGIVPQLHSPFEATDYVIRLGLGHGFPPEKRGYRSGGCHCRLPPLPE